MKKIFGFFVAVLLVFSTLCGVSVSAETVEEFFMLVSDVDVDSDGYFWFESQELYVENWIDDFEYDPDYDEASIAIYKNGREITAEEIAIGDVLTISYEESGEEDFLNITINVSSNDFFAVIEDIDEDCIIANGVEYPYLAENIDDIVSGERYQIYLNHMGEVVHVVDGAEEIYAFATTLRFIGEEEDYQRAELRALTTDGLWSTYELADEVVIDKEKIVVADFYTEWSELKYCCDYKVLDGYTEFYINRMIIFKPNMSGKVKEVVMETGKMDDRDYVRKNYSHTYYESNEENSYGVYPVDSNTLVFNYVTPIKFDRAYEESDIYVSDSSLFVNGKDYEGVDVYFDYKTEVAQIMFGTFDKGIDFDEPMFVVSKVYDEVLDDKDTLVIEGSSYDGWDRYFYVPGYSKVFEAEIPENNADDSYMKISEIETEVSENDILLIDADKDNIIRKAVKICSINDFASEDVFEVPETMEICRINEDVEGMYIQGYVVNTNDEKIYLSNNPEVLGSDDLSEMTLVEDDDYSWYVLKDYTKNKITSIAGAGDIVPGSMIYAKVDDNNDIYEAIIIKNNHTAEVIKSMPVDVEHNYNVAFATQITDASLRVLQPSGQWESLELAESVVINGENAGILNQIVYFTLNESGKVDSVVYGLENINKIEKAKEYNETYKKGYNSDLYGFYTVPEDVVIYNYVNGTIPVDSPIDEKDIKVTDKSVLNSGESYTDVIIYDVSYQTHEIGIMVGCFETKLDFESPFFVVSNVVTHEEYLAISGLCNGEEVTYFYMPEEGSSITGTTEKDGYAVASKTEIVPACGDVLIVNADNEYVIRKAAKLWNVNDFSNEKHFKMPLSIYGYNVDGEDEGRFITGFVCDVNSTHSKAYLTLNPEDFEESTGDYQVNIKRCNNVIFYDFTVRLSNRVCYGSYKDIEPGTMILARVDEDDYVKEAVVIYNEASEDECDFVNEKAGDADDDGKVTVFDAVEILRGVAGITQNNFGKVADVNGDGVVNIEDATKILKYVARIINKF